jgi:hypothetical protein
MRHTEADYSALFWQSCPVPVLRAALLGIIDGYKSAVPATKRVLDEPERHDGLGMIRRGKINSSLRGVAERFGLSYENEPNENRSHYFLSLFIGRFRIVAYLAGAGRRTIKPARLRELWAAFNRDGRHGNLFPQEDQQPVPDDAIYLAFLVHWPRQGRRDQPASVKVVVPDLTLRRRICEFDLFAMFPQIANDLVVPATPVRRQPAVKKHPGKEGTQSA